MEHQQAREEVQAPPATSVAESRRGAKEWAQKTLRYENWNDTNQSPIKCGSLGGTASVSMAEVRDEAARQAQEDKTSAKKGKKQV